VSPTSGLIEAIPDTISLDALKRGDPTIKTLNEFFIRHFGRGDEASLTLKLARANFAASLAAYSIVTYLLQVWWLCRFPPLVWNWSRCSVCVCLFPDSRSTQWYQKLCLPL
jgi:hypothetical protein